TLREQTLKRVPLSALTSGGEMIFPGRPLSVGQDTDGSADRRCWAEEPFPERVGDRQFGQMRVRFVVLTERSAAQGRKLIEHSALRFVSVCRESESPLPDGLLPPSSRRFATESRSCRSALSRCRPICPLAGHEKSRRPGERLRIMSGRRRRPGK